MGIKRLKTNPRLSAVVMHQGLAYLSGQVPEQATADLETQCKEVFGKIDLLLAEAGSSRDQMLSAQIWLTDIQQDFAEFNRLWEAWLGTSPAPARATVQSQLARVGIRVEVMVTAAISE